MFLVVTASWITFDVLMRFVIVVCLHTFIVFD